MRLLLWLEAHGTVIIGAGVAATGIAMLSSWAAVPVAAVAARRALRIYGAVLLTAFFIQRPGVRRLLGLRRAASAEEKERWRTRARRQRYISYLMAAAIGLIGWLMMSKPGA